MANSVYNNSSTGYGAGGNTPRCDLHYASVQGFAALQSFTYTPFTKFYPGEFSETSSNYGALGFDSKIINGITSYNWYGDIIGGNEQEITGVLTPYEYPYENSKTHLGTSLWIGSNADPYRKTIKSTLNPQNIGTACAKSNYLTFSNRITINGSNNTYKPNSLRIRLIKNHEIIYESTIGAQTSDSYTINFPQELEFEGISIGFLTSYNLGTKTAGQYSILTYTPNFRFNKSQTARSYTASYPSWRTLGTGS